MLGDLAGDTVRSVQQLESVYKPAHERTLKSVLGYLHDLHLQHLRVAPIVFIGTATSTRFDVSPCGGDPGFVKTLDRNTLAIPVFDDARETAAVANIARNGRVGLLFVFPGLDVFMRINGNAAVSDDEQLLQSLATKRLRPSVVIVVTVVAAYFHCGRAINRSRIWEPQATLDPRLLPIGSSALPPAAASLGDTHLAYLRMARIAMVGSGTSTGFAVSPRGGKEGFVRALDERTLALPDFPGNNKIETLRNLVKQDLLCLLFLFPGLDTAMRVSGRGRITRNGDLLNLLAHEEKRPISAVVIDLSCVDFYVGPQIRQAKLWDAARHVPRSSLPSASQIVNTLLFASALAPEQLNAFMGRVTAVGLYDEVVFKTDAATSGNASGPADDSDSGTGQ